MKTKILLTFLKRHWLKLVGAGLSIGSFAVDGIMHDQEMLTLKKDLKKEILEEMAKEGLK